MRTYLAMLAILPLMLLAGCGGQATQPDPETPPTTPELISSDGIILVITNVTLTDGTPVPRGATLPDETVVIVWFENRPKVVTWGQIKAMWS